MGKSTGFLEFQRVSNKTLEVNQRITNFKEFKQPLNVEERKKQAARCMNCGVPFCQSAMVLDNSVSGCPLQNLVPEWNDQVYKENIPQALSRLLKTNSFPEFTGRVCPAPCEKACVCGLNEEAVTIKDNELYIIETAFEDGYVAAKQVAMRTGKKVAIVGSGPAGLSCANRLNQSGHQVDVYEKDDRVGGLLMYGIPEMKLEKAIITRRITLLEKEGIRFFTNVTVGKDVTKETLLETYDVVVLCCGSRKVRELQVENANVEGIYYAVDFLASSTKALENDTFKDGDFINAYNKHVVVLGGGDTGNDCVASAIRHQCASVVQLEIMPQLAKRADANSWPQWPKVEKTDYGQEEASAIFHKDPRLYETTIKKCYEQDGKLCGITTVKVYFEEGKMLEVANSEQYLKADMLLIATGFVGIEEQIKQAFSLPTTNRNTIITKPSQYQLKENEKIFTAGDARRGQSLVVWAIFEGQECAEEVNEYLLSC